VGRRFGILLALNADCDAWHRVHSLQFTVHSKTNRSKHCL
jgi:hypothetical protein